VPEGLPEGLLDDLTQALAAFEQATADAHAGRRDHVGARAQLQAVMDDGMELVHVLDGQVRHRAGDDPQLRTGWESARNIVGPFRTRAKKAAPGEQEPPASGAVPAA
jgi:hypothetical protein